MVSTLVGGWPVSAASSVVNCSLRSSSSLTAAAMTAARSAGGVEGHGPQSRAVRAAVTALSTSALAASGTLPTYSPVAGERTSITWSVDGAVHLPPMNRESYSVMLESVMGVTLPSRPTD